MTTGGRLERSTCTGGRAPGYFDSSCQTGRRGRARRVCARDRLTDKTRKNSLSATRFTFIISSRHYYFYNISGSGTLVPLTAAASAHPFIASRCCRPVVVSSPISGRCTIAACGPEAVAARFNWR
ncbi:hypothetical protein EVAR_36156_1 [Eumeta japonica]|uniref:Uncharacterized protein n=1 Tax=Eumeta variegata TaxID=151549 RepID=A0A4C1X5C4_EUMVA|nr:hypothetical protein EVAR_36156_1 [Eumeta japonica]